MLSRPLTVMTRNLYVGADITEPLRAVAGRSGPTAVDALGHATLDALEGARATDFTVRGRLLAQEIAAAAPDLVGLQEVALWRRGPLDLSRLGAPAAETVLWDFLGILLAELAGCGARYVVGDVFSGADVEAPAFTGSIQDDTASGDNVRLTMRDVVLVRADSAIVVRDRGVSPFENHLVADVAGAPFGFDHGFVRLDVERGPDRLRFVTTHLDSGSPEIALAQAGELVDWTTRAEGPVVVVGDFNSDPENPATAGPYDHLRASGLLDAAAVLGAAGPTWGFGPDVSDVDATGFTQRIDFVLARGLSPSSAARTGICAPDRDPATGLWPSDHAGVVVTLQ